ncbi:MAG: hypothetical protein HYU36_04100 [Planctomycetes bacterium]|nr:hypothetical protein [Planctomycetota bacterium]
MDERGRRPTYLSSLFRRLSCFRGFTLFENLLVVGLISFLLGALVLPAWTMAREKSRVVRCIGNLQQIAHTLNVYKAYHQRFPTEPLADFRPIAGMVTDVNVFECPGASHEVNSAADLEGKTSYRYFGTRKDLKRKGLCSDGLCCQGDAHNSQAFDPAHPGKSWNDRWDFGAVYDRDYDNHQDTCLNLIYLDDSHWERLCAGDHCVDRSVEGVEGDASPGSTSTTTTVPAGEGSTTSTSSAAHVHVFTRGADAKITCSFTSTSVSVTSTKDLSNVVLEFSDGSRQKFDGLTGTMGTFSGTGSFSGKRIVGCWVKSGNNSSGDGPGYGEYFPTNAYGKQ